MAQKKWKVPEPKGVRSKILAASAAEFSERGYDGARVDAIARRAGVNKALLYYHVGNKAALYSAVLLDTVGHFGPAVRAAVERATTPSDRVRAYVETFEAAAEKRPYMPRIMLRELAAGGLHLSPPVLDAFLEVFGAIRSTLKTGHSAGDFRPVDPLAVHILLVGGTMLLRAACPLRRRATERGLSTLPTPGAPVSTVVADLLLNGILVRPRRPPKGAPRRTSKETAP